MAQSYIINTGNINTQNLSFNKNSLLCRQSLMSKVKAYFKKLFQQLK